MLYESGRITTMDGFCHFDCQFRAQLLCFNQIDDHVQQKAFPSAQPIADKISQMVVDDEGCTLQIGVLCQQDAVSLAVS